MSDLIEGVQLTKRYDDFTLNHVSIEVPQGYVIGLIGSNGAGKTTTIKALLGLISIDEGEVRAFGSIPTDGDWKNRIGVVFDTCSFVPTMRISDIAVIGRAAYTNWDDTEFTRLIEEFDLPRGKAVKDLSRGMGMKLSLAFALAHHPDLLILDEPTAGLDPIARDEALEYLRLFMSDERHGILISSHITSDLEKIADWIVCINGGRVVFSKSKDDICDRAGIAHCNETQFAVMQAEAAAASRKLHYLRRDYQIEALVSDRFAFSLAHPEIPCTAASIDDYMLMMLKGGAQ